MSVKTARALLKLKKKKALRKILFRELKDKPKHGEKLAKHICICLKYLFTNKLQLI